MQKRKFNGFMASLLLVLTLLVSSACSADFLGYWQTAAETAALPYVEETGTMTFQMEGEELDTLLAEVGQPKDLLQKVTIDYTSRLAQQELQAEFDAEIGLGGQKLPLHLYMDENLAFYLKTADAVGILQAVAGDDAEANDNVAAIQKFFGDSEWVRIPLLTDADAELYKEIMGEQMNSEFVKAYVDEYTKLFTALAKPFEDFDTNILTVSGNTYRMALDNAGCAKLITDLFEYAIDHADEIAAGLNDYIDNSSLIPAEDKEYVAQLVEEMRLALLEFTDYDVEVVDAELKKVLLDEVPLEFDIDYTLTKSSKMAFRETIGLNMTVLDYPNDTEIMKMAISADSNIRGLNNLVIDIPTDKVADMQTLVAQAQATAKPAAVNAVIFLEDDYMSYNKKYDLWLLDDNGWINPGVLVKDSTTYLPLRSVGEACGEEVGWDSAKKLPYVVRDGAAVYVNGYVDASAGRSYLKVRDFEKLGYTVNYTKDEYMGGIVELAK
ncbi:MAG: hypothetical protein IJB67_06440 [Firmicutes bacterium]|nr:hypothetical protein [Bacillota bacterium]